VPQVDGGANDKRVVARAEVVHHQAQPDRVRAVQHADRQLGLGHDRALGDLELEAARVDALLPQQPIDEPRQVVVGGHDLNHVFLRAC
jgi:hypothetical protein